MNQKIRDYVTERLRAEGETNITDEIIIDTIRCAKKVWEGDEDEHRWWVNTFKVVKIGDMLIGFGNAKTTGDNSPSEVGWEFDPSTICEVEPKEVTTTVYVTKK